MVSGEQDYFGRNVADYDDRLAGIVIGDWLIRELVF